MCVRCLTGPRWHRAGRSVSSLQRSDQVGSPLHCDTETETPGLGRSLVRLHLHLSVSPSRPKGLELSGTTTFREKACGVLYSGSIIKHLPLQLNTQKRIYMYVDYRTELMQNKHHYLDYSIDHISHKNGSGRPCSRGAGSQTERRREAFLLFAVKVTLPSSGALRPDSLGVHPSLPSADIQNSTFVLAL